MGLCIHAQSLPHSGAGLIMQMEVTTHEQAEQDGGKDRKQYRGEPFTNPGALFMSRLKSIREALSVMPSGAIDEFLASVDGSLPSGAGEVSATSGQP